MLRERTLQHLLLSVARSIEDVPENSLHRNLIRESCEHLTVQRDKRGPYVITIENSKGEHVVSIDSSRFRFHERGDVSRQVELREHLTDSRTHNWNEALAVWVELLNVQLKPSRGLAPKRIHNLTTSRKVVVVQAVLFLLALLLESATNVQGFSAFTLAIMIPLTKPDRFQIIYASIGAFMAWMISDFSTPVFGLCIVMLCLHAENFVKFRTSILLLLSSFVFLSIVSQEIILGLLPVIVLELIVSFTQLQKKRFVAFVLMGFLSVAATLSSFDVESQFGLASGLLSVAALILIVVVFPQSSESNLLRISAPVSLVLMCSILADNHLITGSFIAGWTIALLLPVGNKRDGNSQLVQTGTPVTIRKN
jgi:hypothetical protein